MPLKPFFICRLRQLVLRMARQAPDTARCATRGCFSSQPAICRRALARLAHAQRQRLQAAQREEAVERAADRADGVLQEPDLLGELRVRRHRDAADHVGVAVQILGRRVHDDVGAELERPLHPRARERVVDDREDAALARELRHLRDIDQPQRRIGRRLDPDHAASCGRTAFASASCSRQIGEA